MNIPTSESARSIPSDFFVAPATWDADEADLKHVRTEVFILEQAIPEAEEWDELDPRSKHVLARDNENRPIATGRLTPDHKIGRMAVLKEWRGKGVGDAIMRSLVERARTLGYPALELHAQTHAVPFYAKFGFAPYGDEFMECGIPHVMMRLELGPAAPAYKPTGRVEATPEPRLVPIESREQAHACVLELLGLARREVCIYTRDLDAQLYDDEAILDALRRVAVSGRGALIRILIQQPGVPARDGHRLIHLARRLPSVFQFRTPFADEDLQYPSAFLLNDRRGFYWRVLGSRYEGEVQIYQPGRHAQLQAYFNQVWERSGPSEELRQLSL